MKFERSTSGHSHRPGNFYEPKLQDKFNVRSIPKCDFEIDNCFLKAIFMCTIKYKEREEYTLTSTIKYSISDKENPPSDEDLIALIKETYSYMSKEFEIVKNTHNLNDLKAIESFTINKCLSLLKDKLMMMAN